MSVVETPETASFSADPDVEQYAACGACESKHVRCSAARTTPPSNMDASTFPMAAER